MNEKSELEVTNFGTIKNGAFGEMRIDKFMDILQGDIKKYRVDYFDPNLNLIYKLKVRRLEDTMYLISYADSHEYTVDVRNYNYLISEFDKLCSITNEHILEGNNYKKVIKNINGVFAKMILLPVSTVVPLVISFCLGMSGNIAPALALLVLDLLIVPPVSIAYLSSIPLSLKELRKIKKELEQNNGDAIEKSYSKELSDDNNKQAVNTNCDSKIITEVENVSFNDQSFTTQQVLNSIEDGSEPEQIKDENIKRLVLTRLDTNKKDHF